MILKRTSVAPHKISKNINKCYNIMDKTMKTMTRVNIVVRFVMFASHGQLMEPFWCHLLVIVN